MPKKVEISHKTIIFIAVFAGALWFLYIIRDLILELFAALLVVAILSPLVERLYKYKVPRGISIFVAYLIVFSILGGAVAVVVPPLIDQTTNLVNTLPENLQSLGLDKFANGELLNQLISQLGTLPTQVVKAGIGLFANVLNVLTVLIFAFYMLLTRGRLDNTLDMLFGREKARKFTKIIGLWEVKLGNWARGQLFLMFLVGIANYLGFLILGIPYALPLALLAGVLEIVPYLGPIIAAVPAVIIAFSQSPFLGFATIALAFLIQQLENYIFVPKVMEKSLGVSPIVTLFSLAVGFRLAGVVGIIVAIPVVITIQILLQQGILKR